LLGAEQFEREVDLHERRAPKRACERLAGREAEAPFELELTRAAALALGARVAQPDAHGERGGDGGGEGRDNEAMPSLPRAPWWTVRPASNRKPSTYRCPICGRHLSALSEHMLIAPEGDTRRRRHAHSECVMAARSRGQLPLREDWLRTQPRGPSLWSRLLRRG
jgi:hypothetical protein